MNEKENNQKRSNYQLWKQLTLNQKFCCFCDLLKSSRRDEREKDEIKKIRSQRGRGGKEENLRQDESQGRRFKEKNKRALDEKRKKGEGMENERKEKGS